MWSVVYLEFSLKEKEVQVLMGSNLLSWNVPPLVHVALSLLETVQERTSHSRSHDSTSRLQRLENAEPLLTVQPLWSSSDFSCRHELSFHSSHLWPAFLCLHLTRFCVTNGRSGSVFPVYLPFPDLCCRPHEALVFNTVTSQPCFSVRASLSNQRCTCECKFDEYWLEFKTGDKSGNRETWTCRVKPNWSLRVFTAADRKCFSKEMIKLKLTERLDRISTTLLTLNPTFCEASF